MRKTVTGSWDLGYLIMKVVFAYCIFVYVVQRLCTIEGRNCCLGCTDWNLDVTLAVWKVWIVLCRERETYIKTDDKDHT